MSITMSAGAIKRVNKLKKMRQTPDAYFRIKVISGGCSGFSYIFDLVRAPQKDDKIFEFKDIKVCVDRKSILILKGTEIEYVDNLMNSGFRPINPSANHTCGCGESFSL